MVLRSSSGVSLVIPVYRGSATLGELVGRLLRVLRGCEKDFEILLIDDASPDNSWDVVRELQASHPDCIVAIQLMRNFGQHNALMCGLRHARGRYVITMDDDLQHPPEELPKLLEAIERTGADVVYGVPSQKRHRCWRNLGSALVALFFRAVFWTRIQPTSFRIIRREVVDAILSYGLNYTYVDGLLAWNTERLAQVEVEHHARTVGRSGYSLRRLLVLALNLFTNFSLLPLQMVSLCGFSAALFGFAMGAYYLAQYFFGSIEVPGYASIIVAIFIFGGLQLLALGIIGEYLGRLHLNVNRKPQYTVRTVLSSEQIEAARVRSGRLRPRRREGRAAEGAKER